MLKLNRLIFRWALTLTHTHTPLLCFGGQWHKGACLSGLDIFDGLVRLPLSSGGWVEAEDRLTFSPRSTLSVITPMNSLWLRQLSPSMSNSLKMVSRTLSERSCPVAIFTARLNWAEFEDREKDSYMMWSENEPRGCQQRSYPSRWGGGHQPPASLKRQSPPGCW